jgi:hypothetical protein
LNVVSHDSRYGDDRVQRRDRAGAEAGAVTGGLLGLVLGSVVPGLGSLVGLVLAVAVGTAAGALAGRAAVTGASVDDWDRSPSERPFVGAHAPDVDQDDAPGARTRV